MKDENEQFTRRKRRGRPAKNERTPKEVTPSQIREEKEKTAG
jgi:hypothetical protein